MPNRIIKESIRTSDTLSSVSAEAERLFWRIVVSSDDYGRFDARPKVILGQCLSSFIGEINIEQVKEWLRELARVKLITIYKTSDGGLYLQLTNWSKHQTPRAKKSKFPSPPESESKCKRMFANVPVFENGNENVFENENDKKDIPPSSDEGCVDDLSDDESNEAQKRTSTAYTEEFEAFWTEYPRKIDKKAAFTKWKARIRKNVTWDKLFTAAKNYATYCELLQLDQTHIMHGSTFLGPDDRYERFIDCVPEEAYHRQLTLTASKGGKQNERPGESAESSEYGEDVRNAFFNGW